MCDIHLMLCQDLHLSGNYLGDAGVAALSGPLGSLPSLRRLYLQVRGGVCVTCIDQTVSVCKHIAGVKSIARCGFQMH